MPTSKDDPKPRKVIDVTEPGKSEPSASARPIIVTNRPLLQKDPMVVGDEPDKGDTDNTPSGQSHEPKSELASYQEGNVIMPPSAPGLPKESVKTAETPSDTASKSTSSEAKAPTPVETEDKSEIEVSDSVTDIKVDVKTPETAAVTTEKELPKEKPAEPEPKETTSVPEPDDAKSATETSDDQLAPNKVMDEAAKKAEEEKAAKAAELEKLVESKKYFLPINAVQLRRNKLRVLLLFIICIILAAALLDISLDAGVLKINGIQPLTHFFNS